MSHPRRIQRRVTAAVLAGLALVACTTTAHGTGSVRSAGMAGTVTATVDGVEGAQANPANLAWFDNPGVAIELLSTQALVGNNGIDLDLYNASMKGHLDDADKSAILTSIPTDGLTAEAHLGASAMGVQVGRVAVTFSGLADATTNLPHDVFELLLMGNATADSMTFDDARGEAISLATARVSTAVTVGHSRWGPIHVGLGMAYLQGLAYARLEEVDGNLVTRTDGIRGEARGQLRTAGPGAGFGLDLGAATEFGPHWRASLAVHNAFAQVHFDRDLELRTFVATVDTLDLETIDETENEEDLVQSDDEVLQAAPFTVDLPRVLNLGVSRVTARTRMGLEYEQGFATRAGATTTPRVSVGAEWRALSWLPLRAGISVGGRSAKRASAGLGVHVVGFRLDVAASTVGEWWPGSPRGVSLAIGTGLQF